MYKISHELCTALHSGSCKVISIKPTANHRSDHTVVVVEAEPMYGFYGSETAMIGKGSLPPRSSIADPLRVV